VCAASLVTPCFSSPLRCRRCCAMLSPLQVITASRLCTALPMIASALNDADGTIFPNSVVDAMLIAEAQTLRRTLVLDFEVRLC
jgi:hypothetical protein